jgi:hypothetical protein
MVAPERRISPRKDCVIPIRFRIVNGMPTEAATVRTVQMARGEITHGHFGTLEGQTVNLSDRGIYFVSDGNIVVGQTLEMYLTLPAQVTGRGAERVRCCARVVHVQQLDNRGSMGVGAVVERFELISNLRSWTS